MQNLQHCMNFKNWDKIVKLYERSAIHPGRKRLQWGDYSKVEEAVNTWFKEVRSTEVAVSGPMIHAKQKEFAHLMNIDDFQASTGWKFYFR